MALPRVFSGGRRRRIPDRQIRQVLQTAGVQIDVELRVFDGLRASGEIATTMRIRRRRRPLMTGEVFLEVSLRSGGFETDPVRKIRAFVGTHTEPKLARLGTIPALHGTDKLLLRRLAVMKQRTSRNTGRSGDPEHKRD